MPGAPMDTLMKTAIVGLGYVGLPLSLQFAISGVEVLGLDIDPVKVDSLKPEWMCSRLLKVNTQDEARGAHLGRERLAL